LFRDFVEKLERAYIAFDGVVGSCLGRAWGGTNHGAERATTLTLFRKTQNPISRNAPHSFLPSLFLSLSLSLSLFLSCLSVHSLVLILFSSRISFRCRSARVVPPSSFIFIQSFNPSFVERERERERERKSDSLSGGLEISPSSFLFPAIAHSPTRIRSSSRVVSIVR